jgi:hypothetical protein
MSLQHELWSQMKLRYAPIDWAESIESRAAAELDRLTTELAAYKKDAEWQPIESAPRDATAILVMRDIWPGTKSGRAEKCNGHNTYVSQWWADEGKNGEWVCYMGRVQDPLCPIDPTHWKPLPAPPFTAAIAAQEPNK